MSYAELLRGCAGSQGQAPKFKRKHKYDLCSVDKSIALGERVANFIAATFAPEKSTLMLQGALRRATGSQPSTVVDLSEDNPADEDDSAICLPYGFWRRFLHSDESQFTRSKRMVAWRSLQYYLVQKEGGAKSIAAMRGMRARGSFRSDGGAMNSTKARGLGFELLQFFVDHVRRLRCRGDSCMLLGKARELRSELQASGWPEKDLPKLEDNAGAQWFKRWRKHYGIARKVTGMKLKVPWSKVKRRIRVFLENIYRLKAFWQLCHPDVAMRFISLDQKPSWFNNAGLTGTFAQQSGSAPTVREDFNKTRERYSILTSVPSWGHGVPDEPPKVALLFKAQPEGLVLRRLRASVRNVPWMLTQTQSHGSYKSSDMVRALDWMLPAATKSEESIIILLDWYSGHLTPEVAELARSKGHVLVFHGGGCTPFTQVNDTHLHSRLARLLVEIENGWALKEREGFIDRGQNKTPKMTRETIMSIVQTAWLAIDHHGVAEKGYKQTGPGMALEGPVLPEDVFPDLLRALEELDPSPDPTEVSMKLRDEAVAYVHKGWREGRWSHWSDCHNLIQDQDGIDEALAEGLEAYDEAAEDTDDDGSDDDEEGDGADDDDHGGGSSGLSAKITPGGDSVVNADDPDAADGGDGHGDGGPPAGADGVEGIGGAEAAHGEPSSTEQMDVAKARRCLYHYAMKTRDDAMLNKLRKQMRGETKKQSDAGTAVSLHLRKRALEHQEEQEKKRREARDEEKAASIDVEKAKELKAKAQQAAEEARHASLRQVVINRRDLEKKKRVGQEERRYQQYVQTQYPAILARRLFDSQKALTQEGKDYLVEAIERRKKQGVFERQIVMSNLWTEDTSFTQPWQTVTQFNNGHQRSVRCGQVFMEVVESVSDCKKVTNAKTPVEVLFRLWERCMPCARKVFEGPFSPLRLLHLNEYIMEKTFVYGVICMGKWLDEKKFPQGVYTWPPQLPPNLSLDSSMPVDAKALKKVAPLSVLIEDDYDARVPPHLRVGKPASSSKDGAPTKV